MTSDQRSGIGLADVLGNTMENNPQVGWFSKLEQSENIQISIFFGGSMAFCEFGEVACVKYISDLKPQHCQDQDLLRKVIAGQEARIAESFLWERYGKRFKSQTLKRSEDTQ